MSAKDVENEDRKILHDKQNDVGAVQCMTGAKTAATETEMIGIAAAALGVTPERTNTSGESRTGTTAPTTTMSVDESDSASGNFAASPTVGVDGLAMSPSSGRGGSRRATELCSDSSDKNNSKRKTRRGKTKRGKRSTSSRPYSKSQWKYHVPLLRTTAANKRRVRVSLRGFTTGSASIMTTKDPFILSDQPPLVPYNTNRFLMEDHMPHVLTPSGRTRDSSFSIDSEENYFYSLPEDEEEFLTKEFSSVYEDARSERLEGLSKGQLIQEYLQLEANYEQVTRRFNAVKSSIKEENESAVNISTTAVATKDATERGALVTAAPMATVDRRRLEDRVRELTTENLELRRQLEHASRIGLVLSAKSSPRSYGGATAAAIVERMDSSSCHGTSSEDSESDSSSSTSSNSSDDDDGSSSSMSDDDNESNGVVRLVADDQDREPLVVAMEGPNEVIAPMESNGYPRNGDLLADEEEELCDKEVKNNEPSSPLSGQGINSPPSPLVMN